LYHNTQSEPIQIDEWWIENNAGAAQQSTTIMFFRTIVQGICSKYATLTKADAHGAYQQEELQKDYAESARIQEASALKQDQEEESM
jgi:hypothetical protein